MCYFVNKKYKTMKIAVAGTGYVGMSMATLVYFSFVKIS